MVSKKKFEEVSEELKEKWYFILALRRSCNFLVAFCNIPKNRLIKNHFCTVYWQYFFLTESKLVGSVKVSLALHCTSQRLLSWLFTLKFSSIWFTSCDGVYCSIKSWLNMFFVCWMRSLGCVSEYLGCTLHCWSWDFKMYYEPVTLSRSWYEQVNTCQFSTSNFDTFSQIRVCKPQEKVTALFKARKCGRQHFKKN